MLQCDDTIVTIVTSCPGGGIERFTYRSFSQTFIRIEKSEIEAALGNREFYIRSKFKFSTCYVVDACKMMMTSSDIFFPKGENTKNWENGKRTNRLNVDNTPSSAFNDTNASSSAHSGHQNVSNFYSYFQSWGSEISFIYFRYSRSPWTIFI